MERISINAGGAGLEAFDHVTWLRAVMITTSHGNDANGSGGFHPSLSAYAISGARSRQADQAGWGRFPQIGPTAALASSPNSGAARTTRMITNMRLRIVSARLSCGSLTVLVSAIL